MDAPLSSFADLAHLERGAGERELRLGGKRNLARKGALAQSQLRAFGRRNPVAALEAQMRRDLDLAGRDGKRAAGRASDAHLTIEYHPGRGEIVLQREPLLLIETLANLVPDRR